MLPIERSLGDTWPGIKRRAVANVSRESPKETKQRKVLTSAQGHGTITR